MITLTKAVSDAVDAVRDHFHGKVVEMVPDGSGGVHMTVHDIDVSAKYTPGVTWLGFQISAAYPYADVYPHYTGALTRLDEAPHGGGIQQVVWRDMPALQLSRRSNGWSPQFDNASLKAEKVITWLLSL